MSRSLTREERRRFRKERRCEAAPLPVEAVEYAAAALEPETITAEWALERLEDAISFGVASLLHQGLILDSQMDDYEQLLKIHVVGAIPKYDPTRKGRNGRTSSAVHFLRVVLERKLANMVEELSAAREEYEHISIDAIAPKENEGGGDARDCFDFGDKGKFVERLDFRLDMTTIASLLRDKERKAFLLILRGHTHDAIVAAMGVCKYDYFNNILPAIGKVLVECDYGPKRREKISENNSDDFPMAAV